MRRDYITSTGIITIEDNVIYIRRKTGHVNYKLLIEFLVPAIFISWFVMNLLYEPLPGKTTILVLYGFASLLSLAPLFYTLYRRSFSNRIPIKKIQSYKIEEDTNGLEVHLILKLSYGRERIITFRKLENQLGAFVAALASFAILTEPC